MSMDSLIRGVEQEYQRLQILRNRPRYFMFGKRQEVISRNSYTAIFENVPDSVIRSANWVREGKCHFKIGDHITEGGIEAVGKGVKIILDKTIFTLLDPEELTAWTDQGIDYIMDTRELTQHLLLFLQNNQQEPNDFFPLLTGESGSSRLNPVCRMESYGDLNTSQNEAIKKSLTQKITYVWGPPGTGKTKTLAALASCLLKARRRVLICTLSNMALDQLLLATLERTQSEALKASTARLGSTMDDRCYNYSKKAYQPTALTSRYSAKSWNQHINTALLVAANFATLTLPRTPLRKNFDCVIVDEASMASIPSLAAASFYSAGSMVIGGDPCQLPPIFPEDAEKPNEWFSVNVFERVNIKDYFDPRAAFLNEQYRMHPTIGSLVSDIFYGGQLKNGPSNRVNIDLFDDKVVFLHVPGNTVRPQAGQTDSSHFRVNHAHAEAIAVVVTKAVLAGVKPSAIGVIAPYNAQVVNILRRLAEESARKGINLTDLKVSTIHSFQGQERPAIIFDITDDDVMPTPLTTKTELINVALSRAQDQLIVVGNKDYLRNSPYFSEQERDMFTRIIRAARIKRIRIAGAG